MAEIKKTTEAKPTAEKMVRIRLPKLTGAHAETDKYVSVNDEAWLIQRGVETEVPERVAYVLEKEMRLNDEALDYVEAKKMPDNLK